MKKQTIRLTENQLKQVIKESVKNVLNEIGNATVSSALKKTHQQRRYNQNENIAQMKLDEVNKTNRITITFNGQYEREYNIGLDYQHSHQGALSPLSPRFFVGIIRGYGLVGGRICGGNRSDYTLINMGNGQYEIAEEDFSNKIIKNDETAGILHSIYNFKAGDRRKLQNLFNAAKELNQYLEYHLSEEPYYDGDEDDFIGGAI